MIAFGLARLLGRDLVHRVIGPRAAQWHQRLSRRGVWAVLAARLVPVVPFTAVNYLAGVTGLRLRDFAAGTVVGILPATTAYVVVGAYGSRPGSWPLWAALMALGLLTAAGVVTGWRHRRHATTTPGQATVSDAVADSESPPLT